MFNSANLLNDCSQGLDHLNRSIFANAIAHKIEECDPPITIGVFGKWGSGKSQLLLQIRGKKDLDDVNASLHRDISTL